MIELYAVAASDEEAFLTAWAAEGAPGHTLHRALRDDAPHRYMSLPGGPSEGALLITGAADFSALQGRQGFIGARVFGALAAVHWSSPLMYQRAGAAARANYAALYLRLASPRPEGRGLGQG